MYAYLIHVVKVEAPRQRRVQRYLCSCVCICICIYMIYMYRYTHTNTHTHTHTHTNTHTHTHTHTYLHTYIHTYTHTYNTTTPGLTVMVAGRCGVCFRMLLPSRPSRPFIESRPSPTQAGGSGGIKVLPPPVTEAACALASEPPDASPGSASPMCMRVRERARERETDRGRGEGREGGGREKDGQIDGQTGESITRGSEPLAGALPGPAPHACRMGFFGVCRMGFGVCACASALIVCASRRQDDL